MMRSTGVRIVHTLGFEVFGVLLSVPLVTGLFDVAFHQISALAIVFSLLGAGWNYLYNLGFDHLMLKWHQTTQKSFWDRVIHTLGFEVGLLLVSLPTVAWWLNISLWEALIMDLSLVVFYLIYAALYNWAFDVLFPQSQSTAGVRSSVLSVKGG